MKLDFSNRLIKWYNQNKRDLPWRLTKDPYKIWVSEIILQQTRINQGQKYYYRFLKKFPEISNLAQTNDDDLLKVWEGLGYYSRAINMLKTAKIVFFDLDSIFPTSYDELIKLPGIGDYTASAISSICANEAQPVVDGNVFRLLSRIYKIDLPINSLKTRTYFKKLGFELIKGVNPGDFNQAMMDYGSLICKPKKYECDICLFSTACEAHNSNSVMLYPYKNKSIKVKERFLNYIVFVSKDNKTKITKRNSDGIWKNLYEFPLIESINEKSADEIAKKIDIDLLDLLSSKKMKHRLSHQLLYITFFVFRVHDICDDFIEIKSLSNYPFPRPINKFISELV